MLKYPALLWLFIIYLPLIVWYVMKYRRANPSLSVSTTAAFDKMGSSWKVTAMHVCFALKLIAIGAVIVALCRPQNLPLRFVTLAHVMLPPVTPRFRGAWSAPTKSRSDSAHAVC